MPNQDQYIRQDVIAQQDLSVQGSTFLGNDPTDTVTVIGKMVAGGTTTEPVASADYGPGPLTNEVIFSFDGSLYDAATCTVTVADDANADVYVATHTIAHNGTSAVLSTASGVADVWGGTNPTFNANYNAGTIELRMDIADAVSVAVAVDAKLFAAQTSEFITIGTQPTADTVVEGDTPATFTVAATSNDGGTLSYLWEEDAGAGFVALANGGAYAGVTTTTLTITTSDTSLNTYDYRCVVSSDGGAADANSNAVTLTVNAAVVTISADPSSTTVVEGDDDAVFTVTASTNETLASLTFQWEVDDGLGFVSVVDDATYDGALTDTLTVTTTDTSLDTYEYRCVVTSDSAIAPTDTSNAAVLTVSAAVVTISADPSSTTVVEGDDPAVFTVVASTNETLASLDYQWEEDAGAGFVALADDSTYSGALTDTLTVTTTDTSLTTYEYRCVVTSDSTVAPTATSAAAVLTVSAATVTISADPSSLTVDSGDPAQFTVVASTNETLSTLTFSWEEDDGTGFVALTDGGVYSGTGTDTLDISDATGLDTYEYRCVVSTDSAIAPTATSTAAVLTVNP
jgi:uncharacterized protein YcfL